MYIILPTKNIRKLKSHLAKQPQNKRRVFKLHERDEHKFDAANSMHYMTDRTLNSRTSSRDRKLANRINKKFEYLTRKYEKIGKKRPEWNDEANSFRKKFSDPKEAKTAHNYFVKTVAQTSAAKEIFARYGNSKKYGELLKQALKGLEY